MTMQRNRILGDMLSTLFDRSVWLRGKAMPTLMTTTLSAKPKGNDQ